MPLQNFVDGEEPTVDAAWLNAVDVLLVTVFNNATTAALARTALGLGTMALQAASAVAITGGVLSGITSADFTGLFKLSGAITPTILGVSQNNYAPAGIATASRINLSSSTSISITGIAGGSAGKILVLYNIGSNNIILPSLNVGSSTENQFGYLTPGNVPANRTLTPHTAIILQYNGTTTNWDAIGQSYQNADEGVIGVLQTASFGNTESGVLTTAAISPAYAQAHPSANKFWANVTVSGGTPTLAASYNVTSITDTNPGQLTVTIATDFSSVAWECQVSVERAATALTVANLRYAAIRFGGQAAGTVLVECWDGTAVTANQVDPAAWHVSGRGDQ